MGSESDRCAMCDGWGLKIGEMESEGLRSKMEGEGLRTKVVGEGLKVIDGGWGLRLKMEGEGLRDGGLEGEGWDRMESEGLRDGGWWCAMEKGWKFLLYNLYKA